MKGNPENWCRNGHFPYESKFKTATVTGKRNAKVYFLNDFNRVETGYFVSNTASKKSIEKTVGFDFEGTTRQSGLNDFGEFEDEHRYAILQQDWVKHYNKTQVEIIY